MKLDISPVPATKENRKIFLFIPEVLTLPEMKQEYYFCPGCC